MINWALILPLIPSYVIAIATLGGLYVSLRVKKDVAGVKQEVSGVKGLVNGQQTALNTLAQHSAIATGVARGINEGIEIERSRADGDKTK